MVTGTLLGGTYLTTAMKKILTKCEMFMVVACEQIFFYTFSLFQNFLIISMLLLLEKLHKCMLKILNEGQKMTASTDPVSSTILAEKTIVKLGLVQAHQ